MAGMQEGPIQRLQSLAQQCVTGQRGAAELELHAWRRGPDCPRAARVLLAALLADRGEHDLAREILQDAVGPGTPTTAAATDAPQLLISLLIEADLLHAARQLGRRLHDIAGDRPDVTAWLRHVCVPGAGQFPEVSRACVERLADELRSDLDAIPSLVFALKQSPRRGDIDLLRRAIARLALDGEHAAHLLMLCQASAELGLLAGDQDDARRWAHRGLELDPYCAPLALVLAQVGDDPAVGPSAREVLARVCARRPAWPDVRAAWIRRHQADGQEDAARQLASQWLEREPGSPLARQLTKDLAA